MLKFFVGFCFLFLFSSLVSPQELFEPNGVYEVSGNELNELYSRNEKDSKLLAEQAESIASLSTTIELLGESSLTSLQEAQSARLWMTISIAAAAVSLLINFAQLLFH